LPASEPGDTTDLALASFGLEGADGVFFALGIARYSPTTKIAGRPSSRSPGAQPFS